MEQNLLQRPHFSTILSLGSLALSGFRTLYAYSWLTWLDAYSVNGSLFLPTPKRAVTQQLKLQSVAWKRIWCIIFDAYNRTGVRRWTYSGNEEIDIDLKKRSARWWVCRAATHIAQTPLVRFVVDFCGFVVQNVLGLVESCGFVVDLPYNLLYNKSTKNRTIKPLC
jgi:hypothetical protein